MYTQDNILCQFGLFRHKLTTISPPILIHFWWELYHAAVVVHNRYIVILGGHNRMRQDLSSVDIMDTGPPHDNNNNNSNGEPMIVAGLSMNLA